MNIKTWLNEEIVAAEELAGKEDLQPLLLKLKKTLMGKSFSVEQANRAVGSFLQQLNSSGFLAKIEKNDSAVKDITVIVNGSDVVFSVVSDSDPRDRKSFTIKGVEPAAPAKEKVAAAPVAPAGKRNMDTFQLNANIAAKAQR
jgi:hypothetical protein